MLQVDFCFGVDSVSFIGMKCYIFYVCEDLLTLSMAGVQFNHMNGLNTKKYGYTNCLFKYNCSHTKPFVSRGKIVVNA